MLKCPACDRPIIGPTGACTNCNLSFYPSLTRKVSFYFSLMKRCDDLAAAGRRLSSQVEGLEKEIEGYENEIESDLALLAAQTKSETSQAETASSEAGTGPGTVDDEAEVPLLDMFIGASEPSEPAPSEPGLVGRVERALFDPELKIGQRWLLIVGVITVVFGVAFFLKYSFEQGWVGPAGRVSLAYLWGLVFLTAGHVARKKVMPAFGLIIFAGGIVTLYFATYAGFQIYPLVPQTPAFLLMLVITVLACATAVAYETQALAILGLVGGFLTPVLLSTGQDDYLFLFAYMTMLNLGILAISYRKRWPLLQQIGFVLTWVLYSVWHQDRYGVDRFWAAAAFVNCSYLIYSFVPFAYYFRKDEPHDLKGLWIMMPNTAVAFAYNFFMIREKFPIEWVSVVTLLYAVLFLAFAYRLYNQGRQQRQALVVMLMKSTFFLIITVPVLLSGHWITILWALQAILLLEGARRLKGRGFLFVAYSLLLLALGKFFLYDLATVFRYDFHSFSFAASYGRLFLERWFTTAFLLYCLFRFGSATRREISAGSPLFPPEDIVSPVVCPVVFGCLLFLSLTFETSAFFHDYLAQARFAAISVVWVLFSASLMLLGFRKNSATFRKAGLALIFITVVKVFFVDIGNISTPYRILSFIITGVVLMLLSYAYHKARLMLSPSGEGQDSEESR